MSLASKNVTQIAKRVLTSTEVDILEPLKLGSTEWQNELLLFVKPEVFVLGNIVHIHEVLELVLRKLVDFNVQIDGMVAVAGCALEKRAVMDAHYGYINQLSRAASRILTASERSKIVDQLELESLEGIPIFGGHEFLAAHPEETAKGLDNLWFTKKSVKLRSGFYVQRYQRDEEEFVLVNGFHPEQLAHFTDPSHRILLMLLHSNTDWAVLKHQMVGATFPERAVSESIRGTVYQNADLLGFEAVTIANNVAHLSAGPFEAMHEVANFFGKLLELDLEAHRPLTLTRMLSRGISMENALKALGNPTIQHDSMVIDLFTATEDMNTMAAVDLYQSCLHNGL